jgi:long-chain fatty acid transport protein
MKASKKLFCLTPLCALLAAGSVHATNGMLMEGYGPISTGMGGASQAIDHGNAGMAQNPATLGMMVDGTARLDVAFGILGPDVATSAPGAGTAQSGGTSYVMPAFGYTRRSGALTYGVGMFAQGGMGTEYDPTAFFNQTAGLAARSELGVGNVIFPVAYQINSNLTIGATVKFMWSSLDMKMNLPGASLGGMVAASGVTPSGNIAPMLGGLAGATWANISFSDENKFTGAAKSTGVGAAIGMTYKANQDVTVGASYQLKSALNDMQTASSGASMTAQGGFADSGQITVIDFQMPSVLAVGGSWQLSPSLLLAADIKSIGWADSMKSFKMRYDSKIIGGSVSFTMPQNWKDQTVLNLGMAWKANDALTLRAGLNLADNPIPDAQVNFLFPATVKDHVTLGLGYQLSKAGEFNMSLTVAPSVSVTGTTPGGNQGITTTHAQQNWQFMYSHRF